MKQKPKKAATISDRDRYAAYQAVFIPPTILTHILITFVWYFLYVRETTVIVKNVPVREQAITWTSLCLIEDTNRSISS